MRVNEVLQEFERFGAVKTLQDLALRSAKVLCSARILKAVAMETVNPEFLKCDKPYRGEFLSRARLTEMVRNRPEYEISERFLREAFDKGDECYGILDGPVLAAYGWYSNVPTAIDSPGMVVHFDDRYIYMYKGFTHVNYRGQRFHAIGKTRALESYLSRGYQGLLSYIEWNNFSSLRSCYRIGCKHFGQVYVARLCGRYITHADDGCRRYSFRLESAAAQSGLAHRKSQTAPLSVPTDQGR